MTTFEPTGTIEDIIPEARPYFEALLAVASELGLRPRVRSAGRTCADQQALKALGPGVTGAGMCRSFHVLGRALDIDLDPNDCTTYTRLGQYWEQMGGVWGGRWSQFGTCGDAGHFHWPEEPGEQSVASATCPADVTLDDCERLRERYLRAHFGQTTLAMLGKGLAGAGIVVAAYTAWRFWRR